MRLGIDSLAENGFAQLRGQRIGLVTNHTGQSSDSRSTIDILHQAQDVTLRAIFSPEHGIRGALDTSDISDSHDPVTGLPVYSLYGNRQKPSSEQTNTIDLFVFDIQDIGCRFYTYISTLVRIMEAADEQQKSLVVLDRPNPITGKYAEGPLPDPDKLSFTACHPIPVRHGMTVGELANLIYAERQFTFSLEIIRCEDWQRDQWYDQTGLKWINPSPNMRSLTAATFYPGVGLLEMTNLSVGRGTETPFEILGAPYLDLSHMAKQLNAEEIAGVSFSAAQYVPPTSVFAGETCYGVMLTLTDRNALDSVQLGLAIAAYLRRYAKDKWIPEKLITLLANESVYQQVLNGTNYGSLSQLWQDELAQFNTRCQKALLY